MLIYRNNFSHLDVISAPLSWPLVMRTLRPTALFIHPYILFLLLHYLIAFPVSTEEVPPPERRVKSAHYLDKRTIPASNAIISVEPFFSFLLQSRWLRQESKGNVRPAERLQTARRKPTRVVRRKAWPSQRDREANRVVWKLAEGL